MRELTQSFGRFSWVMALFGLRQLTSLLMSPSDEGDSLHDMPGATHDPARAFDTVSRTAESELGEAFQQMFKSGERMMRTLVDAMFGWGLGDGGIGGGFGLDDKAPPCWLPPGTPTASWGSMGSGNDTFEPTSDDPLSWVGDWGPMPPIPGGESRPNPRDEHTTDPVSS